jgi:hypothetical protein
MTRNGADIMIDSLMAFGKKARDEGTPGASEICDALSREPALTMLQD